MRGKVKWGVAGLVLGLAAALSIPSVAQSPAPTDGDADRTVTVTGTATIRSEPDEAVVTLGVRTQAATAEAAMRENAEKMTAVIRALTGQGLADDDIATAWVNLYPNYSSDGLAIIGYWAENQVNATVRDMGRVGRVIDRAVAAGANLAGGITFGLSDENRGVDEALEAAVADARHKAEILASAGAAGLGQVLQIGEVFTPAPPPIYYERAAADEAVTPISPPTLETQVTVTVTWELV